MNNKWKYKYRFVELKNGNNETIWRIKRKSWIGIWFYVFSDYGYYEFPNTDEAYAHIENWECQIREESRQFINEKDI